MNLKNILNKSYNLLGNIYFIAILAYIISIFLYGKSILLNFKTILTASIVYPIKIKTPVHIKNVLIFSVIFTVLRGLTQALYVKIAGVEFEELYIFALINFVFSFIVFYIINIVFYFGYRLFKILLNTVNPIKIIVGIIVICVCAFGLNEFFLTKSAICFENDGYFEKVKYGDELFESAPPVKMKDGKILFPPNHLFDPEKNKLIEIDNKDLSTNIDLEESDYKIYNALEISLNNGKIVSIGGWKLIKNGKNYNIKPAQIEIYNPKTKTHTQLKNLKHRIQKAVKLNDGKIFILSGKNYLFYDVKTNQISAEKQFLPNWEYKILKKLNDGRLLVFARPINEESYQKIENYEKILKQESSKLKSNYYKYRNSNIMDILIYDPAEDKFRYGGHLAVPRGGNSSYIFEATVLNDNRVLIYGGIGDAEKGSFLKSAEIYNPETNSSKLIRNMHYTRQTGDNAILLDDGRILLYLNNQGNVITPNGLLPTSQLELYIPKNYKKK